MSLFFADPVLPGALACLILSLGIRYSIPRGQRRGMALNNIAFSYGQMGNGKKARECYEKTLPEFPDSALACAGLNLLNAGKHV